MSVAQAFERLHRKPPSDADLRRIYEIGAAVGAEQDDTFLSIIVALDYYHGLYGSTPDAIKKAVTASVQAAELEAQGRIKELTAAAIEKATEAVQKSSIAAARAASVRSAAQWIGGGLVVAALAVGMMAKLTHTTGYEAGYAQGRAEQRNEELYIKTVDQWAFSDMGKKAYKMSQNGTLDLITKCTGEGWKKENGACYPTPKDGQVAGWMMP